MSFLKGLCRLLPGPCLSSGLTLAHTHGAVPAPPLPDGSPKAFELAALYSRGNGVSDGNLLKNGSVQIHVRRRRLDRDH
jgi:hypothetical protein